MSVPSTINAQLLGIIETFDTTRDNETERAKVFTLLRQYIQDAPDFNRELCDLVDLANGGDGTEEEWMFSLVDALRCNPNENKTHLVSVFKYTAQKALGTNDAYIYFLVNDTGLAAFVHAVPEAAREILPELVPLIKVDSKIHKETAIQIGQCCLITDPLADKVNFRLHLNNCLYDANWKIRYYAYRSLKHLGELPAGFKRSVLDKLRVVFFQKEL